MPLLCARQIRWVLFFLALANTTVYRMTCHRIRKKISWFLAISLWRLLLLLLLRHQLFSLIISDVTRQSSALTTNTLAIIPQMKSFYRWKVSTTEEKKRITEVFKSKMDLLRWLFSVLTNAIILYTIWLLSNHSRLHVISKILTRLS